MATRRHKLLLGKKQTQCESQTLSDDSLVPGLQREAGLMSENREAVIQHHTAGDAALRRHDRETKLFVWMCLETTET